MRWCCLQHVAFEGPAYLAAWARNNGHTLRSVEVYDGDDFPREDQYDGLFILGGPMNVYEEPQYPWLAPEKAFIAGAVADGKPTLGICLGAQLLSVVLGGRVEKNADKEIGWFAVDLTPAGRDAALLGDFPSQCMAMHWHGDCFTIPPGAVHVARSEACEAQGFVYNNRVVGLQFHLESTDKSIAALIEHCGHEITHGPFIQDPLSIKQGNIHVPSAHALLDELLDGLVAGCRSKRGNDEARITKE